MRPKNLQELLDLARERASGNENENENEQDGFLILQRILKQFKFYPAIKIKRYFDKSGLVLIHNSYQRGGVEDFQQLFEECRSVVVDVSDISNPTIVVSLAEVTPIRKAIDAFQFNDTQTPFTVAYEGTTVYVYEFKDKWYFSTSTSPNVNSSRFRVPNKTHGAMMDDVLMRLFPAENADAARAEFVKILDKSKTYSFIIVHHMNNHYSSYEDVFGNEYAELIHMSTRSRNGMIKESIEDKPLDAIGIKYAETMDPTKEAVRVYFENHPKAFGVIAVNDDMRLIKITPEHVLLREEFDAGHPNMWHNLLWVYMKGRADFKIKRFIDEYVPGFSDPRAVTSRGKPIDPTYLIHTVMMTMTDILFNLYNETTVFDATTRRFERFVGKDDMLPPKLRFHLALLRLYQIKYHNRSLITQRVVYHHLTHHCTIQDVKSLIAFFASEQNKDFLLHLRPLHMETFTILSSLLTSDLAGPEQVSA